MFLLNKYTNCYFKIILKAQTRILSEYSEKHHIIPKSLGGDNSKENLVNLTAREHFICHRLLTKMTIGDSKRKMLHAVWSFTRSSNNQNRIQITGRTYEIIRKEIAVLMSADRKGKMNKGKKLSENQKVAISVATKGKPKSELTKLRMKEAWKNRPPRSDKHREALRKSATGRKLTLETKKKMSASKRGVTPIHTLTPFKCEHCGKEGVGIGNYKRWHGDNCKDRIL